MGGGAVVGNRPQLKHRLNAIKFASKVTISDRAVELLRNIN